ncbi:hypothetical protein IQ265_12420 [Nodosilinea sp. LEGE 06152]|uniref:cation-transporting P-type ATPase n=1 Tax=Nodosilinea sp. LEGE 06152 TaxID=2777966 RepID=UPI001881BCB6|nr:cation-transporting P-type ATPase [Nodosilinea sp. LEGE 06152]MBE9157623.1 hypothetical protein [Nodosilinea sp. LEGE 06152]
MNSPVSPAGVVQPQPQELLGAFGVDAAQGQNSRQVERQREKYGWNRLEEAKQHGAGAIFIETCGVWSLARL